MAYGGGGSCPGSPQVIVTWAGQIAGPGLGDRDSEEALWSRGAGEPAFGSLMALASSPEQDCRGDSGLESSKIKSQVTPHH